MNNSGSEKGNESSDSLKFRAEFNGQDWQRREEVDDKEEPRQEVVQNSSADTSMNERVSSNSPEERDGDFEVTPELLMYDMDDDDIPADDEEPEDQELDILEAEKDIPIEELYKKYYYPPIYSEVSGNQSEDGEDEDEDDDDDDDDDDDGGCGEVANNLRSSNRFPIMQGGSFESEESEERDASQEGDSSNKKRMPRVGEQYQVSPLPDKASFKQWKDIYPENFRCGDRLLWNPSILPEEKVREFLINVHASRTNRRNRVAQQQHNVRLPDDEDALAVLEFKNYDVKPALSQLKSEAEPTPFEQTWTQDEVTDFEQGLHEHGKDFFKIRAKLPTKTVAQCIQFYYTWKKSPRYSEYKNKCTKKRDHFSPGASSYLDRLMDDSETNIAENSGFNETFLTHRRALEQHIYNLRAERKSVEVMNPDAGDENTPPPQAQNAAPPTPHTQTPLRLTGRNVKANLAQRRGLERHIEILIEEGKSMEVISPDAGDENTPPPQAQNAAPPTLHTQMNGY